MEPLNGPRGLMAPRVYVSTDNPVPHLVVGCICGWTHKLPDGCFSLRVTVAASKHMAEAHLGIRLGPANDQVDAMLEAMDSDLRNTDGR